MKPHPTLLLLCTLALGSGAAGAARPSAEAKAVYAQTRDQAATAYQTARARCDVITGNPKDVCVAEAKAARIRAEQEAGALYQNTLKAYTDSRLKIASANYDLDKTRCEALTGNPKDVCMSQAKATRVAARADAKADKKAIEARSDARDDKITAEYKVAREKCDAFAGAVKDSCVSAAKSQYGK
jgi:hypothetical protein